MLGAREISTRMPLGTSGNLAGSNTRVAVVKFFAVAARVESACRAALRMIYQGQSGNPRERQPLSTLYSRHTLLVCDLENVHSFNLLSLEF